MESCTKCNTKVMFTYLKKEKGYQCTDCDIIIASYSGSVVHFFENHTKEGLPERWKCSKCNYKNTSSVDVKRHEEVCKARAHKCKIQSSSDRNNYNACVVLLKDVVKESLKSTWTKKAFSCQDCNRHCISKERLLNHIKHCKLAKHAKLHKCDLCSSKFLRPYSLLVHKKRAHHIDSGSGEIPRKNQIYHRMWRCHVCSFYTSKQERLRSHFSRHLLMNGFCRSCDFVAGSKTELVQHLQREHISLNRTCRSTNPGDDTQSLDEDEESTISCAHDVAQIQKNILEGIRQQISNKILDSKEIRYFISCAIRPVYDVDKRQLKCGYCNRDFSRSACNLRAHVMRAHLNINQCQMCSVGFENKTELNLHVSREHPNLKFRYSCTHCGSNMHLRKSCPTLVRKIYTCSWCKTEFQSRTKKEKHMKFDCEKSKIDPESMLTCSYCKKKLKSKASRDRHVRRLHKPSEMCPCTICGKIFKCASMATCHERMVHGAKTFKCKFCDYSSTNPYYRNQHEVTHTREKPFKCDECDLAFTQVIFLCINTSKASFPLPDYLMV